MDVPKALKLRDALKYLDIDRSTFYRYIAEGRLRMFKHGNRVYVPKQSIKDYLAGLDITAKQEQARHARRTRALRAATRRRV